MRRIVIHSVAWAAWLLAMPAAAQPLVSPQDLRNFSPPTDPQSSLYLEKPTTEGEGAYNVGVWFSYANQLLVLESPTGDVARPLSHQFSVDYVASLGFTDRVSVGLALPTVVYQSGAEEAWIADGGELPRTAIGDLRADIKATLLEPGTLGTLALAGLLRGTLPTSGEFSYVGHESSTGEVRLLAELSFVTTKLQATAGIRFRDEITVLDEVLSSDLPWGAAALWTVAGGAQQPARWVLAAEAHGSVGLEPRFAAEVASPLLAGLSLRMLAKDWSLLAGAETGLNEGLGAPRVRAVLSAGYAPRIEDADQDGLEDHVDQCPFVAEDADGFQDGDGCPEVDNDGDAVSDTDDRCPKELEDHDGFQDEDGCPDPDNDGDGIPDVSDACPRERGVASDAPKYHGCPAVDSDGDGVFDDKDRCLRKPEDRDGFKDDDGCPDPDNDGDRIPDASDACPDQRGPRRSDPKLNGCPNPDRDRDTFDAAVDRCPKQPEDFDGFEDDDGCPDPGEDGQPLIEVVKGTGGPSIRLSRPIEFSMTDGGVEIAPGSLPLLRAIAAEMNRHPRWVVLVGVRPGKGPEAEQLALNQSFAVVFALRHLTHRDDVAESVSFEAVKALDQAERLGLGLMVLAADEPKRRGQQQ